jgi:hypothetical protein
MTIAAEISAIFVSLWLCFSIAAALMLDRNGRNRGQQ